MNKHIRHAIKEFIKAEYNGSILATELKTFYAFKHLFESPQAAQSHITDVIMSYFAPYNVATLATFEDRDDFNRYMVLAESYGAENDWPEEHSKIMDELEKFEQENPEDESFVYEETPYEDYARTEMQAIIAAR